MFAFLMIQEKYFTIFFFLNFNCLYINNKFVNFVSLC
ncbi:MAG: hypothetical protein Athens071425_147 [Parcubacteria group bacterium Athens0714_25]|nr:MAG: hypothetical protein Athens071425_147 [Parcubacteria group bacterium Athens0714_25]